MEEAGIAVGVVQKLVEPGQPLLEERQPRHLARGRRRPAVRVDGGAVLLRRGERVSEQARPRVPRPVARLAEALEERGGRGGTARREPVPLPEQGDCRGRGSAQRRRLLVCRHYRARLLEPPHRLVHARTRKQRAG